MATNRLDEVYEEINRGDIYEQPIVEQKPVRRSIYGYCHDKTGVVTINPQLSVLDTLIHELFHRRHPSWSERYVKAQTTRLIRSLTPEQQQALYDHYLRVRVRSRRKKAVQ
jgi:hypothetical protein